MKQKSTETTKQNDHLYPIDSVCEFIDTEGLKKVNSCIKNTSSEYMGLNMGVRIRIDDYEDKSNERIVRKATILGMSIIKKRGG